MLSHLVPGDFEYSNDEWESRVRASYDGEVLCGVDLDELALARERRATHGRKRTGPGPGRAHARDEVGPPAHERARVARVDDVLDVEGFGAAGTVSAPGRAEPGSPQGARLGRAASASSALYATSMPPSIGSEPQSPDGQAQR